VLAQDADATGGDLMDTEAYVVSCAAQARSDTSPPPESLPLQILFEEAFRRQQIRHDALDMLALAVFQAGAQAVETEPLLPNQVSDVALFVELQGATS
jgi:hypothetical protein